ncbi:hypothetical protein [Hoeflea poritis]|uniref:Uncharacterized protein n=1 Tax=Hoeflea poritis TaxID=2993659 RepID=A0ABT4VRX1_9HYPH|nr:hypothetical protein [Hoeflea poritis]MDA4847457.1 hypothetical protein [Hoeflea poritis]
MTTWTRKTAIVTRADNGIGFETTIGMAERLLHANADAAGDDYGPTGPEQMTGKTFPI